MEERLYTICRKWGKEKITFVYPDETRRLYAFVRKNAENKRRRLRERTETGTHNCTRLLLVVLLQGWGFYRIQFFMPRVHRFSNYFLPTLPCPVRTHYHMLGFLYLAVIALEKTATLLVGCLFHDAFSATR
jgi:hypothetical protein